MFLQYISDIHLEFLNDDEIENIKQDFVIKASICVLAGDIGDPFKASYADFLAFCSSIFQKVFVIAGNHEYYHHTVDGTKKQIQQQTSAFLNVSFLDNSFEDYAGIRWIGTTLWTNITQPQFTINDTREIYGMTVDGYNILHQECKQFLETTLDAATNIKCVVITHHIPLEQLINVAFKTQHYAKYNQWFSCSDLEELLEKQCEKISCWIYGHTHLPLVEILYGSVPFVCNPVGYKHETKQQNINQVVEID